MAAMGLITDNAITTGSMKFDGQDLLRLEAANHNKIYGFTMAIWIIWWVKLARGHCVGDEQYAQVIIFNQAVSALNGSIQGRVIGLLKDFQAELGRSMVCH